MAVTHILNPLETVMNLTKLIAATFVFFAFSAGPATSSASAQSIGLYTTTYHVEVEMEHWRSGFSYWQTVNSYTNPNSAVTRHRVLTAALEAGTLCDLLNCSDSFIVRDVRIRTEIRWNVFFADLPVYQSPYLMRSF